MNALIWIGTYVVMSFLNRLIFTGVFKLHFMLGIIPFHIIWFFTARYLSRLHSGKKLGKAAKTKGQDAIKYVIDNIPSLYKKELEAVRGKPYEVNEITLRLADRGIIPFKYRMQVNDYYLKPIEEIK